MQCICFKKRLRWLQFRADTTPMVYLRNIATDMDTDIDTWLNEGLYSFNHIEMLKGSPDTVSWRCTDSSAWIVGHCGYGAFSHLRVYLYLQPS